MTSSPADYSHLIIGTHFEGTHFEGTQMSLTPRPDGLRERNKQAKLERIIAAATELFAANGIDEVTTQQIADRADIGTGTLFLYAKNKNELLLLVQNTAYAEALARGIGDSGTTDDPLHAILAITRPIVECNRTHIGNGRTYLRALAFGDPDEPHHRAALSIVGQTEAAFARVLTRESHQASDASTLAHIITAIMFLAMAAASGTTTDVLADIESQIEVLLRR